MNENLNELIKKAQSYLDSNQLKPAVDALQRAIKIDLKNKIEQLF